jgi:alkyl hydroperoxide reductase subunit AhpC
MVPTTSHTLHLKGHTMLTIGDSFPSFSVTAVKGGPEGLKLDTAFTEITDKTDEGKWKIVFFWPKDFTASRSTANSCT